MLLTAGRLSKVLQLTLAVIKPDAVAHPLMMEALHQRILDNNFVVVRCKDLVWRKQDSERFYAEHSGYLRLVEELEVIIPTKKAYKRYFSPTSVDINSNFWHIWTHSAQREIGFFFPDFSVDEWMEKEEPSFRSGRIHYDHQNQIHTLSS
uniref:Nucleoside diphosphate kinase B n=1 Tax=Acanthochromis polyacanthus TaxID=80966 RepID=A0A3Q1FFR7_9TELE